MRALRWLASSAVGVALVSLLAAPASAAKPVAAGEFTGEWLYHSVDAATCSIAIEYRWENANGIDLATVQFQKKTPSGTEWTNVGPPSVYDPPGVRRTYTQTFGTTVDVTGTQHVFRAVGQAYDHRGGVISGTQVTSTESSPYNCG